MSGLANLDERISKLEAAAERITERTREANSAIKELRKLKREIEHLLGEDARRLVDTSVAEHVDRGLTVLMDEVRTTRDASVQAITSEFEKLADIYTHGRDEDEAHIAVLAHQARSLRREVIQDLRSGPVDADAFLLPIDAAGKKPTTKENP